jgi:hypothetical protein
VNYVEVIVILRKILTGILGLIIGAFVGLVIGLIIGAYIGGNFLQSFVFNGAKGYEGRSQVGAIIGTPVGAGCGILLALKILVHKENRKSM